jgi:hypothetical protein
MKNKQGSLFPDKPAKQIQESEHIRDLINKQQKEFSNWAWCRRWWRELKQLSEDERPEWFDKLEKLLNSSHYLEIEKLKEIEVKYLEWKKKD